MNNKCCKNIATDGPFTACGQEAKHFYSHDGDICSYCDAHNYQCGEKVVQ